MVSRKRLFLVLITSTLFLTLVFVVQVSHYPTAQDWVPLQSGKLNISGEFDFGLRHKLSNSFYRNPSGCRFTNFEDMEKKDVDLRLIVITYARPMSLLRLIKSLNRAYYGDANVMLEVWIDRSKSQLVHNETLYALRDATFSQGQCNIIVHPYHVGIRGQWLTTWNPNPDSSEIAVLLEDDLTVSPHFYSYLKLVHEKYDRREDIYGFSLQGTSIRHSDGGAFLSVPFEHNVFLYPTLGTSGFSPKREHWVKFQEWLKYVLIGDVTIPLLDNHVSSTWYKILKSQGKADSMWEMEYLFYTANQKQFSLYPNFKDHKGFTFNWYEDGLHSTGQSKTSMDDEISKLVLTWNLTIKDLPDNPIFVDNNGDIIHNVRKML